mmetsp:Transcript_14364/g.58113  ORF Transcript_14364/g.58113 Transcript_14364/m.58113 type:complete len:108 (-) Transcript_14364:3419-3742(-)
MCSRLHCVIVSYFSAKVETVAETVPAAAPAAAPAAEENADGKDKIPILDKVYEKFDDMNLNEELLRYVKSRRFLDSWLLRYFSRTWALSTRHTNCGFCVCLWRARVC